ncbi:autotransporter outer membrane beta-barrel domain-containing protein, partial [Brucella anthropi]|uniref:autotransporter outer membrane beta-barrel domain-containing protein n=1 Tax=Brucella anthropi TaxID=529 RepID=UPI0005BC1ED0
LQDGYHAWMRGIGKTGSYSPKSITGYNGHGFDMTTAGVQIGADYSKSDVFVAGDKLTIGIFGEYANSSFDVRGRTADGSISSKGLGGYVTWQQKAPTDRKPGTGAYVDAVVKQNWLEFGVNAKSVSGFDLQNGYKGKATTASIETGYGFDLGNNVVLQPQAQLTWSKVKADSFTDSYGIAVHGQEAESLIGRIGVRLEKTFYFGDEEETVEAAPVPAPKAQKQVKGKKGKAAKAVPAVLPDAPKKKKFVKSVTTYADANVKHEFKGKNGLVASNTGIGNDMGGTRYDVGVGVVARVSENVSLFGRGSVEFGGSTNVAGKVSGGLKITW